MLQFVPDPEIHGQIGPPLEAVFDKPREIVVIKIILADAGNRIGHLSERGPVAPRQTVPEIDAERIDHPAVEGGLRRAGVVVKPSALIEVDQEFVNYVDIDAVFDLMTAIRLGESIEKLEAMLIREGRARQ